MFSRIGFILAVSALFIGCSSRESKQVEPIQSEEKADISVFDSTYAAKLGADDYGMKKYVMAFLKVGPNRDRSKEEAEELQRAHMNNIIRMAEEGVLVLAGPFLDDTEIRGIYVFNVTTIEEAEELTNTDPAVKAGSLVMELHPWYGSAALMEVNEIHEQVARINI